MSKKLSSMLIIFIILSVMISCNKNDLLFTKVDLNNVNEEIKSSLSNYYSENGIYLYENGADEVYLFLNGYNVEQGEKSSYYDDISMEVKDKTLFINFSKKYADNYENKEVENRQLYKINKPENIDTIKVFSNEQETHFDAVIVSK
ncbi:hypothetical protein [Sedimentibacter saalensis]|uniref:Lipoprotein n=1 Tax=Sedimentibacter saalensis TaxID=130788 RepID=A0A562JF35_9FIRM|nr:hypothetical protein [Sedimentibacter saalensis]TWH81673.1 hypothetical protein LY60_01428 [Sedimentibacter saalensis]